MESVFTYLYYEVFWIMSLLGLFSAVCIGLAVCYHFFLDFSIVRFSPRMLSTAHLSRMQVRLVRFLVVFTLAGVIVPLVYLSLFLFGEKVEDWIADIRAPAPVDEYDLEGSPADCDEYLMSDLVTAKDAVTAALMNDAVRYLQGRFRFCSPEFWNPLVVDSTAVTPGLTRWNYELEISEFLPAVGASHPECSSRVIGGVPVHPDLFLDGWPGPDLSYAQPMQESGRGDRNSIMVYWDGERRPASGASCWMYASPDRRWVQVYD